MKKNIELKENWQKWEKIFATYTTDIWRTSKKWETERQKPNRHEQMSHQRNTISHLLDWQTLKKKKDNILLLKPEVLYIVEGNANDKWVYDFWKKITYTWTFQPSDPWPMNPSEDTHPTIRKYICTRIVTAG